MWETNEKKWKQTFCKMIRPRHPAKQSCGRQMKEIKANLWQNDSAKPSQSNHVRDMWETNEKKWKQTFCKMIRPRHPAKQSCGRQMKEIKANLWQNDSAKPSQSNHVRDMWETNEKKWKQTFCKMIRPRHPAKQSCGRQMKEIKASLWQN